MSGSEQPDDGSVALTVPARPEFLRLVRLAAADSGARADLSIEDVEDLRIAVDELTYALIGDSPANRPVTLRFRVSPGRVEIEGECRTPDAPAPISDLSRAIVGRVVDEHELSFDDGSRRFRLVKRNRP